jgi:hypothetical protein
VSYEWGDVDSERHTVYINGQRFEVRHNLYLFLNHLLGLYPGGYKNLWIDALAIDQNNTNEKNHQVQQMKHWYETASKTLIWLGPAADGSDELFDFLDTLVTQPAGEQSSVRAVAKLSREQYKVLQDIVLCAGIGIWKAFGSLARRTYWTRIWTLQEILLAKWPSLVCGSRTCPWHAWAIAIDVIAEAQILLGCWTKGLRAESPAAIVCRQWFSNVDGDPLDSLVKLVLRFQQSECSDRQDKVYALLGLASDASDFPVKYECSLTELLYDLFAFLDGLIPAADARALGEILHVEPSVHDLTTLMESVRTQVEVDIVCELFRGIMVDPEPELLLLPFEHKPWHKSYPGNHESPERFEAQRRRYVKTLPRNQLTATHIEWKVTSLRPVIESDVYSSGHFDPPLRCPCLSCCWEEHPAGNFWVAHLAKLKKNVPNFNELRSIRDDDQVRELLEVDAAIFYRQIGEEMVYLATGVKSTRNDKPRYVLIYDPIPLDSEVKLATTVRATLGQAINLAIHRHIPEMTDQSEFPLRVMTFNRSKPSPDPKSGNAKNPPMVPPAMEQSSKQVMLRADWPLVRRATTLMILHMLVRASGSSNRLEPTMYHSTQDLQYLDVAM